MPALAAQGGRKALVHHQENDQRRRADPVNSAAAPNARRRDAEGRIQEQRRPTGAIEHRLMRSDRAADRGPAQRRPDGDSPTTNDPAVADVEEVTDEMRQTIS
jgi:hypothetical protein